MGKAFFLDKSSESPVSFTVPVRLDFEYSRISKRESRGRNLSFLLKEGSKVPFGRRC